MLEGKLKAINKHTVLSEKSYDLYEDRLVSKRVFFYTKPKKKKTYIFLKKLFLAW